MKNLFLVILVILLSNVVWAQKEYQPNWESLQNYNAPEWYEDAKLGFWPIWGIYSVPAFGSHHAAEWYGRWMYCKEGQEREHLHPELYFEHHRKTYGDQSEFGYKDFIPMFTADKFNADEWLNLADELGAKFFCNLALFHDGFNMGRSNLTRWNALEMGPKRDITQELADASRKKGLRFGVSNHYAFNPMFYMFNHINGYDGKDYPDLYGSPIITEGADTILKYKKEYSREEWLPILNSAAKHSEEDLNRWLARTKELVDLYQPDLYYFDWGMNGDQFESRRKEFAAYYYNSSVKAGLGKFGNPGVVMNYKDKNTMRPGTAVIDGERHFNGQNMTMVWQVDNSIYDGNNWGYVEGTPIKPVNTIVDEFVRIVSNGGVLMLAFAPKADGTFPEDQKAFIREMGGWLKDAGEAIYCTRRWDVSEDIVKNDKNENVRVCYTRSKDSKVIYGTFLDWVNKKVTLKEFNNDRLQGAKIKKVTMLGSGKKLNWEMTDAGLVLDLAGMKPEMDYAWPVKIELK